MKIITRISIILLVFLLLFCNTSCFSDNGGARPESKPVENNNSNTVDGDNAGLENNNNPEINNSVNNNVYSYLWQDEFPFLLLPYEFTGNNSKGAYSFIFARGDKEFVYGSGGVLKNGRGLLPFRAFEIMNYEACSSRLVWEDNNDN